MLGVYLRAGSSAAPELIALEGAAVSQSAGLCGLISAHETPLTGWASVLITAESGSRCAAGGIVALCGEPRELSIAARRLELQAEAARLHEILSLPPKARREAADLAARELAATSARGEIDSAAAQCLKAALGDDKSAAQRLGEISAELRELQAAEVGEIRAPRAGIFIEGCEYSPAPAPETLAALTPSELERLMCSPNEPPPEAFGRMVSGNRWYYAAIVDAHTARELRGRLALDFGEGLSYTVSARLDAIGEADGAGRCVALFSSAECMAEAAALRTAPARLIWGETEGFIAPAESVFVEGGEYYVWAAVSGCAVRRQVKPLLWRDNFVLLAPEGGLTAGLSIVKNPAALELTEGAVIVGK